MNVADYYEKDRYKEIFTIDRKKYYFERVKVFSKILSGFKFNKVLDAGCGDGGLIKEMQKRWEIDAFGLDISKKGVQLALQKGIKAQVADLSKGIPVGNRGGDVLFDLIIANEIIEHLNSPDLFLKECRRLLKKNGLLIIGTPNLSFWLNRVLFIFGIYPIFLEASTERKIGMGKLSGTAYGNQPVGHVHVFNLNAIRDILKMNEFSIEKIIGTPIPFEAPGLKPLNRVYEIVDAFFSHFPSLSPDIVILARKK